MNKELQQENVSEKKKKKSTVKRELDLDGAVYCFKERILCPRSTEEINGMAKRLWEYAQNDSVRNFERFCAQEGIGIDMLRYWSHKNEYFKQMYERSKLLIGARLDEGIWNKTLEYRNKITMYNYLKRYSDDDTREDQRKIKLANEGVVEGQTKVILVKENLIIPEEKE